MADPADQSIEKLLTNIMGHTVDIANLLKAKSALDLAMREGTYGTKQQKIEDFIKASGLTNANFGRDAKGHFKDLNSITKGLIKSFKLSDSTLNGFNKNTAEAAKNTKEFGKAVGKVTKDAAKAINFSYSIGRGKYAVMTPFQKQRTSFAHLADILSVGVDARTKNAALNAPNFNIKGLFAKGKYNLSQKLGLTLGRVASGNLFGGTLLGGVLPATALGALGAISAWAAGRWTDALKTSLSAGSLSMGMAARGAGAGWGQRDITGAIFRGRLIGASSEEARNALTQGQMAGLTLEQSMSALSATKALGISNAVAKTQTVARRILGQDPNDPAKFFSSLKPVAEKTRLSLEELTNAAQEAAGAFRGQLDANALRGVLGKFGDLVRTGEFSWGEIFSTAGTMQRLSPNQQIAAAHFAAVGGYQFRNTDALGRAYELQRMGGKNIGEQTKALRDAIRGVLISSRGSDRWDLLTDAQKYTYGNYVLSGMGLTDFYKQPGGELLMEKIMTNGLFTNDDITAWENATTNSTEKIAQKMEAIINPLNYINTYVAALAVNAGAGKVGEWAQKAIDEFVDKQTHLDVHIFNKFGSSVGVELGLNRSAGMPVPIKVDPQAGGN